MSVTGGWPECSPGKRKPLGFTSPAVPLPTMQPTWSPLPYTGGCISERYMVGHLSTSGGSWGVGGLNTHTPEVFLLLACQYMKIPADLDPTPPPPFEEFRPRTPPPPPRRIPRSAPVYHWTPATTTNYH